MRYRKVALIGLEVVFVAAVIVIAVCQPKLEIPWWLIPFLPLAVMRASVTVSENEVMSWLREPFCVTVPDDCGAGLSVNPKPGSVIGALLACPICAGTWCALVLVALYALLPSVGTVAIVVLGAAGASEFLYYAKERQSWSARLARSQDGQIERPRRILVEDGKPGPESRARSPRPTTSPCTWTIAKD
jgi:hypothetical protein